MTNILLKNRRISASKGAVTFLSALVSVFLLLPALASCGKDKEPDIPVIPPAVKKYEYLKLLSETAHNMTVAKMSDDHHYKATTTGQDPYVSTDKLAKANPADSTVFCFEYKSSRELEFIQIFFAEPVAEQRSIKSGKVPASGSWKEWAVTLKTPLAENSWGNAGQYLRLDFGNDAGYEIELRNIHFRGMTVAEKEEEEAKEEKAAADRQFGENIRKYLEAIYASFITEVDAGTDAVTVRGNYAGEGSFVLCEIPPYLDVTQLRDFTSGRPLSSPAFSETFERFVMRDGFNYDRTLSKWVIARKGTGGNSDMMVSHARYPDRIAATQTTVQAKPSGKKGLGGYFNHSLQCLDLDDLGITSVTVNVPFTAWMRSRQSGNDMEHSYGGKSYYFDRNQISALDAALTECYQRNIVVAAILLVQPAAACPDPEIGDLLQHPDFSGGFYTMPDMTSPASVNTYAAALDFLAGRYCRSDGRFGRIHHWIMHNEVDAGIEWTNMGRNKPMPVYADACMKSMRMCYNIVRQYDRYSEVFGSFTHSWKRADNAVADTYASLDMLHAFNDYCKAEGDFQWALAYHCYPQDLNEPKTWNDADATYSTSSTLITFKNLEVLDRWAKQPENLYNGTEKRTVWLSENGTNSRTYGETDLLEQAAGFAWGWIKLRQLDGIDAMQWHNWADNEAEFGLRIGLRKFGSQDLERKEVWYAYKAAGTADESNVFQKYLPVIGISDWNIIRNVY
ncbi:MAG: DUF5722 domain-containing protein [Bacteroidales bacterium]|jgi:hypothetical protein|nr:DUF5722 domain-containing protein [Bacteroidales bacterium]